jgi:uncharacterized membrane protein (UPF0127 family)
MAQPTQIYRLETESGQLVADHITVADTSWSRFKGLMMVSELPEGHGICIRPCNQIHMFFMKIALDVAFVDKDGLVLHALKPIKRRRISKLVFGSKAAIELPVGTLDKAGVSKGSKLVMKEV